VTTAAHARQQRHDVELAARRDGTIVGLRAEVLADLGAYTRSLGVLCPSITAASLPGPYRIRHYACRVRCALTCKAPAAAYRGAGQSSARLDRLTDKEHERFGRLNAGYREKFGFPFIIAVRTHEKAAVLAAFERRLGNTVAEEIEAALAEVFAITRFRLNALVTA